MSDKDDINLKVQKVKKSKKSFLSLIATAIGFGAKEAEAYISGPIKAPPPPLVPIAPIAGPPIAAPGPVAPIDLPMY